MAEPLGTGLRPARYCGLTSPDPVSTVNGHRHTPPAPAREPRTSRRTRERQEKHALNSSQRRAAVNAALGIQPVDRG